MQIRILSDLHLEFLSESQQDKFIEKLDTNCDVLILAGDVTTAQHLQSTLEKFSAQFEHVVFVAGNHELYDSSPTEIESILKNAPKNVHALENQVVDISGQRFLGCSLWFTHPKRGDKSCLTDFYVIRDFEPWVYERNAFSVRWLENNVQPGDVVVTHHLPAPESIHPKYAGSAINDFFLSDVSHVIKRQKPALWFHGHTHESRDYRLDSTRVVCNPLGYFPNDMNPSFDSKKTIELQAYDTPSKEHI